jgi:hypothetical protein
MTVLQVLVDEYRACQPTTSARPERLSRRQVGWSTMERPFFICRNCPLKAQCWPKAPFRRVPRSIYEEARDIARKISLSRNRSLRARENAE